MKRDHFEIEALIALEALDGLDPAGEEALARERADHGAECEECGRFQEAYKETAGRLAFALDPVPVREGSEERVVRVATAPESRARAQTAGGRKARGLVAAAVAAVLVLAGAALGYLVKEPGSPASTQALESLLAERGARVVRLSGSGNGNVAIAYRPGDPQAFLIGTGLSSPPAGKTYELWRIRGKRALASGCFRPSGDGPLLATIPAPAAADTIAVTVEPGCAKQPSSAPVLSARLGEA